MHFEISEKFIESIDKNTFLKNKARELYEIEDDDKIITFFHENPDFIQMLMNLSNSKEIKIVYDEEEETHDFY